MNARLNALATVLDVLVLVGLGLGLFFAPLTLVWAFDDGFSTDLVVSWAIAVDGWLLGHGVPLTFSLDPVLAQSLGLGELTTTFVVDIALLGIGLLTLLWGYRIGRRSGTRIYPVSTWFLAVGTLVGVTFVMVFFLPIHMVSVSMMDALVRPALFLATGLALATWVGSRAPGGRVLDSALPDSLLAVLRTGIKAGGASVLGLLSVASIAVAILLVASFGSVISLYESLQPGTWGIIALSMAQLALLPTAIIWSALWMVGPGFALGTGALVSPVGTTLQIVPALPLLGIIPDDVPAGALIIVALPLLVCFMAGVGATTMLLGEKPGQLWRDVHSTELYRQPLVLVLCASVLAGAVTALGGFVLASLTSGAAGPGRFITVGADPGQVALCWGVEAGVGVVLGLISGALGRRGARAAR
ncbi:MAG: hypothetical protein HOJ98_05815 [Microbacteriaceae bacterium]|nr:hypothetical protein [Microbacteriaceae bacterium]